MSGIKNEIAKNILFYRKKSGMTQKQLADKLGIKHNAVSNWETATNAIDMDSLINICTILGISLFDMFGSYAKDTLSPEDTNIAKEYHNLDIHGKRMVEIVITEEKSRMDAQKANEVIKEQAESFNKKKTTWVPKFAKSKDDQKPCMFEMDNDLLEKLKNAPGVMDDDDL